MRGGGREGRRYSIGNRRHTVGLANTGCNRALIQFGLHRGRINQNPTVVFVNNCES